MFINRISLKKEVDKNKYPFNISILKNFEQLLIDKPVIFFVGENGTGKSTLIEAIAVASGINAEGGSQNFKFSTSATHSNLCDSIILSKTGQRPSTKYFLRAESFYNVATEIDKNFDATLSHGGKSLHECSHGEAFMSLVENRFYDRGLYILDEPEAALSPLKQMRLLVLIDELVKNGSQFIIATHSPIIFSYPDATIYDFDNDMKEIDFEDTEHYKLYKLFIEDPKRMTERLFE